MGKLLSLISIIVLSLALISCGPNYQAMDDGFDPDAYQEFIDSWEPDVEAEAEAGDFTTAAAKPANSKCGAYYNKHVKKKSRRKIAYCSRRGLSKVYSGAEKAQIRAHFRSRGFKIFNCRSSFAGFIYQCNRR